MNSKEKSKFENYSKEDLDRELSRRETIQKLKELDPSFLVRGWYSIKKNTAIWIPTALISIFSIFSDYFIEEIQTTLNDANFKSEEYAEIANELSEYNFSVELVLIFFEKYEPGSDYFKTLVDQYNENILNIRGKEYSNHALILKHSGELRAKNYENLIDNVKAIDRLFRELNPVTMVFLQTQDGAEIVYTQEMKDEIDKRILALKASRNALIKKTKELLIALE